MHWFTQLFLLFLLLSTAVRSWLNQRQRQAVLSHRDEVPAEFAGQVDLAAHQKAADYTLALNRLGRLDMLLDAIVVMGLTIGGGIQWLDRLWQPLHLTSLWHGTAVVISVLLLTSVVGMPLSLYRTFGIEARFGFNRTTFVTYVVDLLKGLALGLILGVPLLYVILLLMERAGELWWLYAWVVWVAFTLFVTWAFPTFIAPLFNKFTPLSDETLRQRTEALLERCGFASKGVFVMDGSKRSVHGNAYFTGVGRNKRIVFFDTLIERLQAPEIEAGASPRAGALPAASRAITSDAVAADRAGRSRTAGCTCCLAGVLSSARSSGAFAARRIAAVHAGATRLHLFLHAHQRLVVAQA